MSTKQTDPESGIWRRNLAEWSRALFEGIDDAVFVHDLRGRILDANPAASRRLGYTREEFLRLYTRDIDDPAFAANFESRLEKQMTEGNLRCEGKHRTKDGRTILVDINTSAIEFHGKPCVLAVMRDITEQKKAEQTLVKQKELLRSVLESMGDGVLVVDENNRLLVCNPVAQRLFGISSKESLQQWPPKERLFKPDQITPFPPDAYPWQRAIQGKTIKDAQIFIRAATDSARERFVSMTARPLRGVIGGVRAGIVVCHDITEQKQAERRQTLQYAIARIITGAKTYDNLGQMVLKTLCEGLAWDLALLWTVDKKEQVLRCSAVWNRKELSLKEFTKVNRKTVFGKGVALPGRVWESKKPVWVPNIHEDPKLQEVSYYLKPAQLQRGFAFPIWSSGEITGVVESFSRFLEVPNEEMLTLAATLGSQIGQTLKRQRVEHELRESQAFYHSLVESLPQNLIRKDRQGRVTFANQNYCQLLGISLGELIGKTDLELFPEETAKKYRADDIRVLETGEALELVEEHYKPDGEKMYVQVVKTPILDDAKNIIGTQVLFWDVTERIRYEEALEASEWRYRQLTEATLDAIVVSDQEGIITLFNPAAEKLFGYKADEVVGYPLDVLIPLEYVNKHQKGMRRFVESRVPSIVGKAVEMHGRRKDGTQFPMELALSAINLEGEGQKKSKLQFLGAIRDLTERNRMRSTLIQNEKLASIGLMSAGVAHEINNPLAFIGNNLAVLQRDLSGIMDLLNHYQSCHPEMAASVPEKIDMIEQIIQEIDLPYIQENIDRLLNRTRDGVDRVARIVQSLRGLARTSKTERQLASIPDLVDTSLEMVLNRIKRLNIMIESNYDPDPVVSCVPPQISQVLLNLFVNAIQALEASKQEERRLHITVHRLQEEMAVAVADNGPGIPEEHRSQVFDPFFTTKDVGEGTGLGLSISHNIISSHGGRFEVESEAGRGTTFRFFLPLNSD